MRVKINTWQRGTLGIGKFSVMEIIDWRRKNMHGNRWKIHCVVDGFNRVVIDCLSEK